MKGADPVGMIVDSVSEVLHIQNNDIEEPTYFGMGLAMGYILGIAKTDGDVTTLIDIDRLLDQ